MLKNGWGIFPVSVSTKNWSTEDVICGGEADYDPLWDKEPDEANAHLIAAAPELLDRSAKSSELLMRAATVLRELDHEELALDLEAHVFDNEETVAKARGGKSL
jgi:hypothetical protein